MALSFEQRSLIIGLYCSSWPFHQFIHKNDLFHLHYFFLNFWLSFWSNNASIILFWKKSHFLGKKIESNEENVWISENREKNGTQTVFEWNFGHFLFFSESNEMFDCFLTKLRRFCVQIACCDIFSFKITQNLYFSYQNWMYVLINSGRKMILGAKMVIYSMVPSCHDMIINQTLF